MFPTVTDIAFFAGCVLGGCALQPWLGCVRAVPIRYALSTGWRAMTARRSSE